MTPRLVSLCLYFAICSSVQGQGRTPTATVVCFGDSTTAPRRVDGRALTVYADLLRRDLTGIGLPGPVINAGAGGSHTGKRADNARHRGKHAMERFEQAVREQQPDLVTIQFGLNDAWVDQDGGPDQRHPRVPVAKYRANLEHFVRTLKGDGAAVILMTPNAIGSRFPAWRREILREYVDAVRAIAAAQKVELLDVWKLFSTHDGGVDGLLLDGMHPDAGGHRLLAKQLLAICRRMHARGDLELRNKRQPTHYTIPLIDLSADRSRQVVVDREKGQYLGHPTTVLLEDHKTMIAVYPKGHGRGAIVMKRSADAGLTWSERLPVPANWSTSKEVPTIHRVVDKHGVKRLIVFSGLYPCRMAVSQDDGRTWSPLRKVGDWGGIVVMGCLTAVRGPGHYMAMFHDDGRFFAAPAKKRSRAERKPGQPKLMRLFKTFSADGGLTWSFPEEIYRSRAVHLCEPGVVRSPDGKRLAVLLRENRRVRNSHVIFSDDEGATFTDPIELPAALTGDRHTGRYGPDGRLFLSFRDTTLVSPTKGDWVGWVGTFDDIVNGREGQYRVRLMDNHNRWDCAYPGVEILPNGQFVTTTYGHWTRRERPYIVNVRFRLAELDRLAKGQK